MVRDKFPRRMPTLESNPLYAEYLRSPQYREWVKSKKP